VAELLGGHTPPNASGSQDKLLVKICGTRTADAAIEAMGAGADLIGMILVPGRKRTVPEEDALAISEVVHSSPPRPLVGPGHVYPLATDFFTNAKTALTGSRPQLVGVFQNQPLEDILHFQKLYNLDIVQLHGNEPLEWTTLIPVPVIKSFKIGEANIGRRGYHAAPLVDAGNGGSGERVDISEVKKALQNDSELRVLLAGGLNPENVTEAVNDLGEFASRVIGVDVSSGVEAGGVQSVEKITAFIKAAKHIR
jgi:anthranilate synthase/indole-3-glycerol phosphate synthase/phosphoribosylanthranilate isomerase